MTVLPVAPLPAPASVPAPGPALTAAPDPSGAPEPAYRVSLATCQDDVRAAQRLRHLVFAGELGARLEGPEPGLDSDAFDAYCDHLLVRETATGDVVATYRLLPPDRARIAGRLYAESEFDLTRLAPIRDDLVEVGRSCVHPHTATARSSPSSGPDSPATWSAPATPGSRAAAPCHWPTAARAPPGAGTPYARDTSPRRSTGSPRTASGTPPRTAPGRLPGGPPAPAARLPPARRPGLRSPGVRPRLQRRRPVRPALAAPHRPALPAPLPLPGPVAMSVWLPVAPCTPDGCARHTGAVRAPLPAAALLLAGCALVLLGVACVPLVRLLGAVPRGG